MEPEELKYPPEVVAIASLMISIRVIDDSVPQDIVQWASHVVKKSGETRSVLAQVYKIMEDHPIK